MQKHELNEQILEKAPYGVFVANKMGQYLQVNPAACHITGYNEEELLKMDFLDLIFPEDKDAGLAHFASLQKHRYAYIELPFKHKTGSRRYWSVAAAKLADDGLLAFCFDISDTVKSQNILASTEKKLTETNEEYLAINEELTQTNEELKTTLDSIDHERAEKQLILNTITDMVIFHDINMNVVWTNTSAARAVNANVSEIIGKPCHESFGNNPGKLCDGCPVVVSLKERRMVNYRKFRKDGKIWDIRSFPAYDLDGKLTGVVETMTNITEMVKAEQTLKSSEVHLKEKVNQLETLNNILIGRENKMLELKEEVNSLLEKQGLQPKYRAPGNARDVGYNNK